MTIRKGRGFWEVDAGYRLSAGSQKEQDESLGLIEQRGPREKL